jgi:integrase
MSANLYAFQVLGKREICGGDEDMKGCRPFTAGEVQLIQHSFGGRYAARDRALFLLGVKSGFRISELLSLRVGQVLQYGRLVERITVERRHMKRQREGRTVLLHAEAKAALAGWLMQLQSGGAVDRHTFVFRSQKGANRPISRRQALAVLRDAVVTNGLTGKLGTHAMRKTFAQNIYRELGYSLAKTQRALGHQHVNSTIAYLNVDDDEIDAAMQRI